jgi:hypothetical protein
MSRTTRFSWWNRGTGSGMGLSFRSLRRCYALVIRDRHCRFPGCDRPPDWTEAHHVRWITHGGATALDNLVLVCTRHHHLLHTPGWHAKLLPDATLEVTDPDGRTHTSSTPDAGRPPPLPLRE